MNNTLHTPAPWQLTFGENDAAIHNDVTIASINDDALACKANAHLISAAPDLLSALQSLLHSAESLHAACDYSEPKSFEIARAAIAKAKGAA